MKQSRRAKRMQRHHRRNTRRASINLVSLMDIFTILVFFLLVNSGDVQVLPSAKRLTLPDSVSEQPPQETVVVTLDDQAIRVQGRAVVALDEVDAGGDVPIVPLQKALAEQAARQPAPEGKGAVRRSITIMGDKQTPYRLLRRVMSTCAEADFANIYLAVTQQPTGSGEGAAL